MAKLSNEQIAAEVEKKGCKLIDAAGYVNMQSRITVQCAQGHLIETCMTDLRHPSFTCPHCDKSIQFINPAAVPSKGNKYRVIAFDQATEKFGLSIFDDGQLVFYHLYVFSGDVLTRLTKINIFVRDIILKQGQPDYVIMEDIQLQNGGVLTYKILAMLLGLIEVNCNEAEVLHEVVSPNVGRKYAGTCGSNRREEKLLSIAVVKEKYGIKVTDDVAEAILIGRYGARMHTPNTGGFGTLK